MQHNVSTRNPSTPTESGSKTEVGLLFVAIMARPLFWLLADLPEAREGFIVGK